MLAWCLICYIGLALPSHAEDSHLLSQKEIATLLPSVGRLSIDQGDGFCTASLVSEKIIVTAAHCLFDSATGQAFSAEKLRFQAGWRAGKAYFTTAIKRVVTHPDYQFEDIFFETRRIRNDIALLELKEAVPVGAAMPFKVDGFPALGAALALVSYQRGKSDGPHIQQNCRAAGDQIGMLVLACEVTFGSSGAPVFYKYSDGRFTMVSLISAKAQLNGQDVALGPALQPALARMYARLYARP